ncbi:MAG: hypothetical protein U9O98_02815 [Asgard group archaeon]|nr:hypothetical protein [Asgard group archaeon]
MTIPFELQMIHRESGVQIFSYRFREDIKLEPTLISGFISAVITFAEELKPSKGKQIVKFIDRGDFVLQVEPGELVIGLLILSRKDYSYRDKLRILVREFEERYYEEIKEWSGVSSVFNNFEEEVMQLISRKQISPYHVPTLINSDRAPKNLDDIKWAIITKINGENDICTISDELDLSTDVVQSIISYLEDTGLVNTDFKLTEDCILEITKKGLKALKQDSDYQQELLSIIDPRGLQILQLVGTERSVQEILHEIDYSYEEFEKIVESLVSERYLEMLPEWKILLDKKSLYASRIADYIDDLFQLLLDETDNWISFRDLNEVKNSTYALTLVKNDKLTKILSEQSENLIDLPSLRKILTYEKNRRDIIKDIEPIFRILQSNIEREIGSNLMKDILNKIHCRLSEDYQELINKQKDAKIILNWLK